MVQTAAELKGEGEVLDSSVTDDEYSVGQTPQGRRPAFLCLVTMVLTPRRHCLGLSERPRPLTLSDLPNPTSDTFRLQRLLSGTFHYDHSRVLLPSS